MLFMCKLLDVCRCTQLAPSGATCNGTPSLPLSPCRVAGERLRAGGLGAQALSQDLLAATLEIPFAVPPYMALLARAVATLEGIALLGNPDYQMVTQARWSLQAVQRVCAKAWRVLECGWRCCVVQALSRSAGLY